MTNFKSTKIDKYFVRKYNNGSEFWFLDGNLHREDKPAVIYRSGTKYWYFYGKKHRVNGPAIIYNSSFLNDKWIINDTSLSKEYYKLIPIQYRMNIIYEKI